MRGPLSSEGLFTVTTLTDKAVVGRSQRQNEDQAHQGFAPVSFAEFFLIFIL